MNGLPRSSNRKEKVALREQLVPPELRDGPWSRELILHRVAFNEEVVIFEKAGIKVMRIAAITNELKIGGALGHCPLKISNPALNASLKIATNLLVNCGPVPAI